MPRLAVLGLILVLISSSAWAGDSAIDPARIDPAKIAGLAVRSIGPAGMSGRVAAVEGVDANPDVLYAGAANGGVWKSVNGGLTWAPVFDDVRSTASIGAIAVFQANPDVVWVGTGEGNPRNSVAVGD
ncbi:MAG TPA: hypothetical protein VFC23_00520, partial [Thermoanaerobaculia bacterium]|nr:hypothetical protein [Thermoanaerobaculia bacterium]